MEVFAAKWFAGDCFQLPRTSDRGVNYSSIDSIFISSANFAEPSPSETFISFNFLLLKIHIECSLSASRTPFKLVNHRIVEFIAAIYEDESENYHLDIHEAPLERYFFFMFIKIGRFLGLFCHLLINALLSQVLHLLIWKLWTVLASTWRSTWRSRTISLSWVVLLLLWEISRGKWYSHSLMRFKGPL